MKKVVISLIFVLGLTLPLGSIAEGYSTFSMLESTKKLLEANPLDRDYNRDTYKPENGTTYGMAMIEAKYIKLWDRELNVIYQKLLLKLNDEERELLVDSQVAWLQHHEKEQEFTRKAFSKNAGSFSIVMQAGAYANRLRDRTLQLMAYYYRLGGEIAFEYKGDAE
jgi:uncharacterized protein YecT (DUF1311 family)